MMASFDSNCLGFVGIDVFIRKLQKKECKRLNGVIATLDSADGQPRVGVVDGRIFMPFRLFIGVLGHVDCRGRFAHTYWHKWN